MFMVYYYSILRSDWVIIQVWDALYEYKSKAKYWRCNESVLMI
jgi:hypothetical protein